MIVKMSWIFRIPEILQCQQLSYLLKELFIKRCKHFKILHKDFYSFGPVMPAYTQLINTPIYIHTWQTKHQSSAKLSCIPVKLKQKNSLIQCFKIFLLPNLEKYLHRIAIVVHLRETGEVPFNLLPIPIVHLILKILHVKEKARFLLKPIMQ